MPPRAVFYYACDLLGSAEELFQVIRQYQEFSQSHKFKRRYIFIDEISLVQDWQYAVKQAIDLGWGQSTTFILTGSSAVDIKRGAERLPGRRGRVSQADKVLMPLDFRGFVDKCSEIPINVEHISLQALFAEPKLVEEPVIAPGESLVFFLVPNVRAPNFIKKTVEDQITVKTSDFENPNYKMDASIVISPHIKLFTKQRRRK